MYYSIYEIRYNRDVIMLVYAKYMSPRLQYVLNFIFTEYLGSRFTHTGSMEELESYTGSRIAYTGEMIPSAINIPDSGFLFTSGIGPFVPVIGKYGGMKVLFPNPGQGEMQYDVFAAVFYMISRYEEYMPFKGDRHGRFGASASLAAKEGFLELPMVDLWLEDLRQKILERFPDQSLASGKFGFSPTIDVDNPYAVLHRKPLRALAAGLKSFIGERKEYRERREILSGRRMDPFDTYEDIEHLHAERGFRPVFFYLCAGWSRHDRGISPRSGAFRSLVRQTSRYSDTGIHPSFRSSRVKGLARKEADRLGRILGFQPRVSRQHYLKIRMPETYRNLLSSGIREDYSMGFADAAGFRAGTSRPFNFFDLEREEETGLRIHPFQLMDRTLKDYMGLSAEEAWPVMMKITESVHLSGGTLVSIWHNDTFSDRGEWKGWRELYIRMLDHITALMDK